MREMLVEAVEKRFGAVEAVPTGHQPDFITDNGGAYIAAETRAVARSLGRLPVNTPVCSPQSDGIAESFVNTCKHDYVARYGPARCGNRAGAVASGLRAL